MEVFLKATLALLLVLAGSALTDLVRPKDGAWGLSSLLRRARKSWLRVICIALLFGTAVWVEISVEEREQARIESIQEKHREQLDRVLAILDRIANPQDLSDSAESAEPSAGGDMLFGDDPPDMSGPWLVDVRFEDGSLEQQADCTITQAPASRRIELVGEDSSWVGSGQLAPSPEGWSLSFAYDDGRDTGKARSRGAVDNAGFTVDFADLASSLDESRGTMEFRRAP